VVAIAAGTAVMLIVGVLGAFFYQRQHEQPIVAALTDSQTAFSPALTAMATASDLTEVKTGAQAMKTSLPTLHAAQQSLQGYDSELSRAAADVVSAQTQVAESAAPLTDLTADDMSAWGSQHERLVDGIAALERARDSLAAVDGDRATNISTGKATLVNLETVMGKIVTDTTGTTLGKVFHRLAGTKTTADIRAIANEAAQNRTTVQAVLPGVDPSSAEGRQLKSVVNIYTALMQLGTLDADHLNQWASTHSTLEAEVGTLPGGSGPQVSGNTAIRAVSHLVTHARQRLADWRLNYHAAVQTKSADGASLRHYRDGMNAHLQRYAALRSDLSTWIDRVDSGAYVTWDEAYSVLSQAQGDRQAVRDAISGLTPPANVVSAHTEMLSVIDDAISATQAGYDGMQDSNYCSTNCYYKDTPGWQRFSSESSRITAAFSDASEAWDSAIAATETSIEDRQLPKKPIV
jgi:hypothetical protein